VARHRRPVNVRDDGLPAVLGSLVNEGGVERAVLLDVDSGMVLDAWARGEGVAPDAAAAGGGANPDAGGDTVPGGGRAVVDGASFGGGAAAVVGSWFGAGAALDGGAALGAGAGPADVEALGARHADLVRALFALAGTPPAELSLAVDDRHHLVRCVADPAGGRLALAVVVAGSSWVVRRVRRHLRQLPDAGLTTGPWILSWAMGPSPAPKPPVDRPRASDRAGSSWAERPTGEPAAVIGGRLPSPAAQPQSGGAEGWPAPPPAGADGWPSPLPAGPSRDEPLSVFAVGRPPSSAELQDAGFPSTVPDGPDFEGSPPAPNDDSATTAVPDPRRGPAPPSALPPARSAGGR
jgi:hypothetical protein